MASWGYSLVFYEPESNVPELQWEMGNQGHPFLSEVGFSKRRGAASGMGHPFEKRGQQADQPLFSTWFRICAFLGYGPLKVTSSNLLSK